MEVNVVIYLVKLLSTNDRLMSIIDKDIEKNRKAYNSILYDESMEEELNEPIFTYGTFEAKNNARKIIAYIKLDKSDDIHIPLLRMLKKAYPYFVNSFKKGMDFKTYYITIANMCPSNIVIYTVPLYMFLCDANGIDINQVNDVRSEDFFVFYKIMKIIEQRNDEKYFINMSSNYDIKFFKNEYNILKTKGDLETREKLGAVQSFDMIESILRNYGIFSNDVDHIRLTNKDLKFAIKTIEEFLYPSEITLEQLNKTKNFFIDGANVSETYDAHDVFRYTARELLTIICSLIQISKDYTNLRAFSESSIKEIYKLKNDINNLEEEYNSKNSDKENKLLHEIDSLKEQLNDMQVKYDKLNIKYIDEKSKTELLEEMLEHQHDNSIIDELDKNSVSEETISYPENTILWGGNPRWQKFFVQQHPEIVKIISGTERNAPVEIFSDKANLILINTGHMAHASYYKYMPHIKKIGVKYIFV